jgi:hypothetical protein
MRLMGCPERSLKNYCPTLRKILEEGLSHLHHGRSLKSHFLNVVYLKCAPFFMLYVLRAKINNIQGEYKLSEEFAKQYFHKYWTEIHDVTTIWRRNVCSFILTLNAFDVRPTCNTADVLTSRQFQRHYQNCESASTPQSGTSHKTCLRGFGGNGSIAW